MGPVETLRAIDLSPRLTRLCRNATVATAALRHLPKSPSLKRWVRFLISDGGPGQESDSARCKASSASWVGVLGKAGRVVCVLAFATAM